MARQISSIDGVAVVATERATGPHPRWRDRTVAYSNVTRVLLETDEERYICDVCFWDHPSLRSVVSHMSTHTDREPQYPIATIKTVIRTVEANRQFRNKCERAAAILNKQGVPTLDGERWLAAQVSRLYRIYKDKYAVTVTKSQKVNVAVNNVTSPTSTIVITASSADKPTVQATNRDDLAARAHNLADDISALSAKCAALARDIATAKAVPVPIDPIIVEKARMFDELQAIMKSPSSK